MEAVIRCNAKAFSGDRYLSFEEEDWLEMSDEDDLRVQDEWAELGGMSSEVGGDEVIAAATGLRVLRRVYALLALNGINRAMAS